MHFTDCAALAAVLYEGLLVKIKKQCFLRHFGAKYAYLAK